MNKDKRHEVLQVASRATGQVLFSQPLGEWFRHDLIARTAWAAAFEAPRLRGNRLKPQLASMVDSDNHVTGWFATLSSDRQTCYTRQWPATVLHATALAIGQQYQAWLGDGRVLYWVEAQTSPEPEKADDAIEFDERDGDGVVEVPNIATAPAGNNWRFLSSALSYGTEVLLALYDAAYEELTSKIADSRYAEIELAWAGTARIGYLSTERTLVYEVASLTRLSSPTATAALCPVAPDELVGILHAEQPVVFVHTHVVPEGWKPGRSKNRILACSQEDLRCYRRLPVGSLGLIAASRTPLCVRAYGWPADAHELVELNTAIAVPAREQGTCHAKQV